MKHTKISYPCLAALLLPPSLFFTGCASTASNANTNSPDNHPAKPTLMACDPKVEKAEKEAALSAPKKGARAEVVMIGADGRTVKANGIVQRGYVVLETDIVAAPVDATTGRALFTTVKSRRWPNATIPYEFDASYNDRGRVASAMKEWEQKTKIRFVKHTNEPKFVVFKRGEDPNLGWSSIGMVSSGQTFLMGDNCDSRVALHELGHTIGLYHEQSRPDRDNFICIKWSKIKKGYADQFNLQLSNVATSPNYDYDSIMHYFASAFGDPSGTTTMVPKDPTKKITGQRHISAEDAIAVNAMYQ